MQPNNKTTCVFLSYRQDPPRALAITPPHFRCPWLTAQAQHTVHLYVDCHAAIDSGSFTYIGITTPRKKKKKNIPRIFSHLLESRAPLKPRPMHGAEVSPPPPPPSPPSKLVKITDVIGAQKQNKAVQKRKRKAIVYIVGCSATCFSVAGCAIYAPTVASPC